MTAITKKEQKEFADFKAKVQELKALLNECMENPCKSADELRCKVCIRDKLADMLGSGKEQGKT